MPSKFSELSNKMNRKHQADDHPPMEGSDNGNTSNKKVDRSITPVSFSILSSTSLVTPLYTGDDSMKDTVDSDELSSLLPTLHTHGSRYLLTSSPRLVVVAATDAESETKCSVAAKSVSFSKDHHSVTPVESFISMKRELWYDGKELQQSHRDTRLSLNQDTDACNYLSTFEKSHKEFSVQNMMVPDMTRCALVKGIFLGYGGLEKTSSEITRNRKALKQRLYECVRVFQSIKLQTKFDEFVGGQHQVLEMLRFQCETITQDSGRWASYIGKVVEEANSFIDATQFNQQTATVSNYPMFMVPPPSPLLLFKNKVQAKKKKKKPAWRL